MRVDIVLDAQLAGGDDALGLVADVEENLVTVDLDDGAVDDVAVVEVLDGRVDGGEEVVLVADVVDRNLRCRRWSCDAAVIDGWTPMDGWNCRAAGSLGS